MRCALRSLPFALLLAGCEALAPALGPGAGDAPVPHAPLPPALTCESGTGPRVEPPPATEPAPPPMAGQMSEQAIRAKRLFDGEKWSEAVMALQVVWAGQTGDDEGNRQFAQYHMAIALYRLHREDEAIDSFRLIAANRSHLKHRETLLWLYKLVTTRPERVRLTDFSAFDEADVSKFDNANQREFYYTLSYMLGRERAAEGKTDEARRCFAAALANESQMKEPARRCIAALG